MFFIMSREVKIQAVFAKRLNLRKEALLLIALICVSSFTVNRPLLVPQRVLVSLVLHI